MIVKVGHPQFFFRDLGWREGQLDISDIVRRGRAHVSCQQAAPLTSFATVINLQAKLHTFTTHFMRHVFSS